MLVVGIGEVESARGVDRQVVGLVELPWRRSPSEDSLLLGLHVEGDHAVGGALADDQLAVGVEHHAVGVGAVVDEEAHALAGPVDVDRVLLAVGEVDVALGVDGGPFREAVAGAQHLGLRARGNEVVDSDGRGRRRRDGQAQDERGSAEERSSDAGHIAFLQGAVQGKSAPVRPDRAIQCNPTGGRIQQAGAGKIWIGGRKAVRVVPGNSAPRQTPETATP